MKINLLFAVSVALSVLLCSMPASAEKNDGNRLTYLDEFSNPYFVSGTFPKLTTPQWVGEPGVEAVVVLAIDDMRDEQKYEQYLRPILQRLKEIDGRAPVSIMTCRADPESSHLQSWLAEGVSLEVHTVDHPCPLLQGGDLAKAKSTYDRCVDMMNAIPGNRPVAYRMPCCDSLNTVSPRFYTEIFNKTTERGQFLEIDTSVFNVFTSNDPEIPRELVVDADGREKFGKYVPYDRSFVNTIENYPYPYVIADLCWEFSCVAPSDWSAQHLHKPFNPDTVRDLKAALDITVVKQGVMNLVFHPHGWIRNDQMVELIDHAVEKHGSKVKFLTFREARERLTRHLLNGTPLRDENGSSQGIKILDVDNDGFMDVVGLPVDGEESAATRIWSPENGSWTTHYLLQVENESSPPPDWAQARFGVFHTDGAASVVLPAGRRWKAVTFTGTIWDEDEITRSLADTLNSAEPAVTPESLRLRDIDADGRCEVLVSQGETQMIYRWSPDSMAWRQLPVALPEGTSIVTENGDDAGLRFVDLNEDGYDDVVFSNADRYVVALFESIESGWSRTVLSGRRGEKPAAEEVPMVVRGDGTNHGMWFHSRHLWVQNEDTAKMPNLVDRRSYDQLLKKAGGAAAP